MCDPAGGVVEQSVQRCRVFDVQPDVIASRCQTLQFNAFTLKRIIPNHKRKALNTAICPLRLVREHATGDKPKCSKNRKTLPASLIPAARTVTRRKPKQKYRGGTKKTPAPGGGLKIMSMVKCAYSSAASKRALSAAPFASTSRSTNSIIAMGAMSP